MKWISSAFLCKQIYCFYSLVQNMHILKVKEESISLRKLYFSIK